MKMMKRGILFIIFLFAFILISSSIYAYNGYSSNTFGDFDFGNLSPSELAQNEWVNAALLFLLIFTVCWFALQNFFGRSPTIAFVMSFVLGLMGSLGTIYYFGNIIPKIAWWVLALFIILILSLLWYQLKGRSMVFLFILLAISLVWILWLKNNVCYPYGPIPQQICIVLDAISIVLILITIIMILMALIRLRHRDYGAQRGYYPRERAGTKRKWPFGRRERTPRTNTGSGRVNIAKLKSTYSFLMRDNAKIFKQAGNKIPKRGTRIGEKRARNLRTMKKIEVLAKRYRFRI